MENILRLCATKTQERQVSNAVTHSANNSEEKLDYTIMSTNSQKYTDNTK